MAIEYEQSGNTGVLTLAGELSIEKAQDLKNTLLECKDKGSHVEVKLDKATDIDLACLQVLCSAHRIFDSENKVLCLCAGASESFRQSARRLGFVRPRACDLNPVTGCLFGGGEAS